MKFFSNSNTNYIGIDLGSSGIKVVEMRKEGDSIRLLNYGFSENRDFKPHDWHKNPSQTARVIRSICSEAGIVSKNTISALPTFSVFSSILNLSSVSKKDIASAVHWEAKKVIPLPLEEMILDWKRIDDESDPNNIRVLLTGAPKTLVKKYIEIFKEAQLNLLSLETETFSLIRALLGNDRSTIMMVEIGSTTTDISIIDKSIPMLNRSIDVGGYTITKSITEHLQIDPEKAEQFKYDLGISHMDTEMEEIPKSIIETISPIINEIKYAMNLFESKYGKKTEKIILSGGSSLLPNLSKYISNLMNINVIIGDPWTRVAYPQDLRPLLNEIGPRLSIAIGLAMRELE